MIRNYLSSIFRELVECYWSNKIIFIDVEKWMLTKEKQL